MITSIMKNTVDYKELINQIVKNKLTFRILFINNNINSKIISSTETIAFKRDACEQGDGIFIVEKISNRNYIVGLYFLKWKLDRDEIPPSIFENHNNFVSFWEVEGEQFSKPIDLKETIEDLESYYGTFLNNINRKLQPETVLKILKLNNNNKYIV
ncbi:hypothetical protein ACFOZ1_08885 [Gracilibacillus marinus]|uniref:Uncharacterized protein n=1 Tax=Gracilibacillus marinus TaxID=630535 RepID=A0ABV8VY22_9BACI